MRDDIRRCAHPKQKHIRKQHGNHQQDDAAKSCSHHCGMDGILNFLMATGAEIVGYKNIDTYGQTQKQGGDQIDQ